MPVPAPAPRRHESVRSVWVSGRPQGRRWTREVCCCCREDIESLAEHTRCLGWQARFCSVMAGASRKGKQHSRGGQGWGRSCARPHARPGGEQPVCTSGEGTHHAQHQQLRFLGEHQANLCVRQRQPHGCLCTNSTHTHGCQRLSPRLLTGVCHARPEGLPPSAAVRRWTGTPPSLPHPTVLSRPQPEVKAETR